MKMMIEGNITPDFFEKLEKINKIEKYELLNNDEIDNINKQ